MKIFETNNSLDSFLRLVKNKRVDITVAFASKTEAVIESLLDNGNEVHLTVGTINCFSDPVFFKTCQEIASNNPNLNLTIDFRYDSSIHWKVYLISPNIVIIGSSNLTTIGLSMRRDTAVRIKNSKLYQQYMENISNLRADNEVVAWDGERFEELLSAYEKQHHKTNPTRNPPIGKTLSFTAWFAREESQSLPLYLSDCDFTEEEMSEFEEIVSTLKPENTDTNSTGHYPIGICYKKSSYVEGAWLLRASHTGASPAFHLIHTIKHHNKKWWLCGIKRRIQKPFSVSDTNLKQAIIKLAPTWYENGKTYLDSSDLQNLVNVMQPNQ
jgi:phosphatidylserine/phosphatidylglycerophosphate/cardiolipin synthase-like enzyme